MILEHPIQEVLCLSPCLTRSFSRSEFSLVVPDASVLAWLGSSAVLPCGLSPSLNAGTFEVRWYRNNDYDELILLYQDQKVQGNVGGDQYRARASLIGDLDKGNVSLKLDDLTAVDSGAYMCFVKSISWYERGSVNLVVKGNQKTQQHTTLLAPSIAFPRIANWYSIALFFGPHGNNGTKQECVYRPQL